MNNFICWTLTIVCLMGFSATSPVVTRQCTTSRIQACYEPFHDEYGAVIDRTQGANVNKSMLSLACMHFWEKYLPCLDLFRQNCTETQRKLFEGDEMAFEVRCGEGRRTTTVAPEDESDYSGGLTTGEIVGIVMGFSGLIFWVVVIILIALGACCVECRKMCCSR